MMPNRPCSGVNATDDCGVRVSPGLSRRRTDDVGGEHGPAGGLVPLDLWRSGDGLVDVRHIDLSALPSGRYTVVVGVYDPAGGQRLAAQTAGGRLPDDIWVIGEFER